MRENKLSKYVVVCNNGEEWPTVDLEQAETIKERCNQTMPECSPHRIIENPQPKGGE